MEPSLGLTRPWPEDAEPIALALADWETVRWLTAVPWPYDVAAARDFIANAGLDEYAVRMGPRLVGMVRAGTTFGIWIAPDQQGQGIGRRASILALSRRFFSGAPQITTYRLADNRRSARLLEGMGFRLAEEARIWSEPRQEHVEALRLTLSLSDFEARHPIILTTPRLRIDPIRTADFDDLHRIVTSAQVSRMVLRFRPDMDPREMRALLTGGGLRPPLRLAVRLHDGPVIGTVGLAPGAPLRLHYFLDPAHAGRGLGQEMVAAFFSEIVARYAPEEVAAEALLDNLASRKILRNLGFREVEDVAVTLEGHDRSTAAVLYRWRARRLF
ncbi:MAG: GNAT family N-acetyltransferase [Alphaproteobacteria bacterium]|nr:GNAT family N-acetyltransferase [Alphaproteobacteria bacterium]